VRAVCNRYGLFVYMSSVIWRCCDGRAGSGVHRAVQTRVPASVARAVVPLSQSTRSRGERFAS